VVMFLFHPYGDIITRRQGVVVTIDVIWRCNAFVYVGTSFNPFVSCETLVSRSIFLNYVCTSTFRDWCFLCIFYGDFLCSFLCVQVICMYVIFVFSE
jgi:hypothetical protein